MKQKYYVNVHYDVVLRVEVVAGIEEDVLQLYCISFQGAKLH